MANQDPPTPSIQLDSGSHPSSARRARAFVLRLLVDAHGNLRGTVSEPGTEDGWQPAFASLEELLSRLQKRIFE